MKIDRLLAIIMYLLNRELVSARELAEHFEVSTRTIQRDMDTLCSAGIPVLSVQGSHGGFGIIESYKLDRQFVNTNDLFFILTSLESIRSTFKNKQLGTTVEKIKTLIRDHQAEEIERRKEKLYIDFSAFSIGKHGSELFYMLENAIENNQLISFSYINSNYQTSERVVEPMTIVFKWYSWYLFAYCRLRQDYRIFRLSRMHDVKLTNERFTSRDNNFSDFSDGFFNPYNEIFIDLTLKFHPSLIHQVEDYFRGAKIEVKDAGDIIVNIKFPENEWLYGMILSYGDKIEVIAPDRLKEIIRNKSKDILKIYQ